MTKKARYCLFSVGFFFIFFLSFLPLRTKNFPFTRPIAQSQELDTLARGIFLLADPRIVDPNFRKTVVLILHHDEEGTMGLIINRSTAQLLSELLPEEKQIPPDSWVFFGGPVSDETLTVLFRSEKPPKTGVPVFENVYASQDAEVLASLFVAETSQVLFRLYAGYAGWGPGQLQGEIARGDWRLAPADADLIFKEISDRVWPEMFSRSQKQVVKRYTGIRSSG